MRSRPHRSIFNVLGRFTLGNIDVFTTWQGSVVYVLVIGVSLLALNRQQQDLAQRNSFSLEPVRADVVRVAGRSGVRKQPVASSLERTLAGSQNRVGRRVSSPKEATKMIRK